MNRGHYLISAIFVLGLVLRIAFLSTNPVGFTPDEASFGYDAYSIIKTGKDQWGNTLPIVFKSFGDYKMPLYTYLSTPTVFLFGLNEFAVRLPSAIFGALAVVVTYLLTKEIYGKKVGLVAALLLAVSPWHMPLSRGAFEANLTTFFMPLGILLFLKGKKDPRFMAFSMLAFGLNLFTYHSARLVTPVVMLSLIYSNYTTLKTDYKKHFGSIILIFFFLAVSFYSLLLGSATRAGTSTIFATSDTVFQDRVGLIIGGEPLAIAKLFNNRVTYVFEKLTGNYLEYFSTEFLFIDGAKEGTYGMLPGEGALYLFELVSLASVVVVFLRKKEAVSLWLLVWLFIAPIPAALSIGPGWAANRAVVMLPALTIFSALGMYYVYKFVEKVMSPKFAATAFLLVFSVSSMFFLERYFYQQPVREARAMVFGAREIMDYVESLESNYSQIIVTKELSEPHIFVAFYKELDPSVFQNESVSWRFEDLDLNWVDQMPRYSLGKYQFKSIDWIADLRQPNTLIVAPNRAVPENATVLAEINYPSGRPAYVIIDTKVAEFAQK